MSSEDFESESTAHGCCGRNKLSICLAIIVMLLVIILSCVIFLFIGFIKIAETQEECTNSACIKASAQINELIDDTVDPCEDFYAFVCGKFDRFAYEKQIDNLLNAEYERIVRHIDTLIVEPPQPDDPQPVKMQKSYFQACLNEEAIDEDGDQTLFKRLLEVGDWPFLRRHNEWDEKHFEWSHAMIKARDLGLPFEWFLKVDLFNDDNYELKLSHPENCGVALNEEYFAMQRDILEQLTRPGIDTISEFAHLEQFERKLNSICSNKSNSEILLTKMVHLRLENVKAPYFLKAITGLNHKWRADAVVALNMDYIFELNRLLKTTPKKVQANYILWKIIEYFSPYLSKSIRDRHAQYLTEISEREFTRFRFCLEDTKSKFKFVSELVQLKQYADSEFQETGEELVASLKEEIVEFIESVEWRNNKSKESYLMFYENLETIIGGPEEMFEDSFLTDEIPVGKLVFFFDNIIQMIIDWSRSSFLAKMRMIGEPAAMDYEFIYEANSKFAVVLNNDEQILVLPISAFNSILYDSDLPQYLNYAGLGTFTSKELIRGLHSLTTSKFESYKSFEENKKCFIENFQKSHRHLNASLLYSRNYESLMAQQLAYRAYQTYVESNEEEQPLINLPYSPNQLFWIKSCLNWCYHPLPEEENHRDLNQVGKYRILETVKNSEFFASDFNCSSETAMNPKNKCQIL